VAVRGLAVRGVAVRGLAVRGVAVRGLAVRGLAVRGLAVRGLADRGLADRGLAVRGLAVRGLAALPLTRVAGMSMLASIARRPWTLRSQAVTLAGLHSQLHAIAGPPWLPAPFGDADTLLHLDLHPDNVLVTSQGVMVIDWQNAARGPAGADLAKTWIILATASVPGSAAKAAMLKAARQLFLRSFLGSVDAQAARSFLPPVAEAWTANPRTSDLERAATSRLVRTASARKTARHDDPAT
jgi:Phosphotransferase enzyme family